MLQELFHVHVFGHDFRVYGYGLMLVVAFLACVQLATFLGLRSRIDPDHLITATLLALGAGIIGARLCHVLENFSYFTDPRRTLSQNLFRMFDFSAGGLTFYGGFLFATPCLILYAISKRIPVLKGMDLVAPVLMVGLGVGRIGCFLNGCCYGQQCSASLGVEFPYYSYPYIEQFERHEITPPEALLTPHANGVALIKPDDFADRADLKALAAREHSLPVLPTQIYSFITAFLIAGVLLSYYTLPRPPGAVFALMLMIEGACRFILEMLRVEPPVWGRMSLSMVLGMMLVICGIAMWTILHAIYARQEPAPALAS
jgi:phosphatidylglycerol:prolipoprotein diacylglycerol transferase